MRLVIPLSLLALIPLLLCCSAPERRQKAPTPDAAAPAADATQDEVVLPARGGWRASLLLDNDVGVWTVGGIKVFPKYGCPEVFGLDDKGRCTFLISYSGKWTQVRTVGDGAWLGALQQVDLDPHQPGAEIYTGGRNGNLFQLVPHDEGDFDTRIIARFPGQEIHTLIAGDLDPRRPGNEMLGFTHLGRVFEVQAPAAAGGAFEAPIVAELAGRVRQAEFLPAPGGAAGGAPWFAATCRSGQLLVLCYDGSRLVSKVVSDEPMGFGRLAVRRAATGGRVVLYASRDDGVVLRFEGSPDEDAWRREVIYAGPQGPRGVAVGRFHEDPAVESVAVFGYSKRVQLLSRAPGEAWHVETIFEDRDKGHWLAAVEIDGRNGTDELVGSGYGARVFALSRPPGYGLPGVQTDPDARAKEEARAGEGAGSAALRVATRVPDAFADEGDFVLPLGSGPFEFVRAETVRGDLSP